MYYFRELIFVIHEKYLSSALTRFYKIQVWIIVNDLPRGLGDQVYHRNHHSRVTQDFLLVLGALGDPALLVHPAIKRVEFSPLVNCSIIMT